MGGRAVLRAPARGRRSPPSRCSRRSRTPAAAEFAQQLVRRLSIGCGSLPAAWSASSSVVVSMRAFLVRADHAGRAALDPPGGVDPRQRHARVGIDDAAVLVGDRVPVARRTGRPAAARRRNRSSAARARSRSVRARRSAALGRAVLAGDELVALDDRPPRRGRCPRSRRGRRGTAARSGAARPCRRRAPRTRRASRRCAAWSPSA